jgi:hypothetical protein
LFYLGTAAYRAGALEIAAAHWQVLSEVDPDDTDRGDLISAAKANLGHFTYYGIVVEQDKDIAVQIWRDSANRGELSAMSYLGVAFSDPEFPNRDNVVALAWFKTLLAHGDRRSVFSDIDQQIIRHANVQIESLEESLSRAEIAESEAMAKRFSESIANMQDE